LARLRGGTAPLQIEIGRYICLPVEERTCKTGMVEDEEHLCVGCPGLKETRGPLLKLMEQAQHKVKTETYFSHNCEIW